MVAIGFCDACRMKIALFGALSRCYFFFNPAWILEYILRGQGCAYLASQGALLAHLGKEGVFVDKDMKQGHTALPCILGGQKLILQCG